MNRITLYSLIIAALCVCHTTSAQLLPKRLIESKELLTLTKDMRILVQENIFYFKKVDKIKGVVEFTYDDALELEKYFINMPGVLTVESDFINKKFIVTSKKMAPDKISYQKVYDELSNIGYIPTGARSNTTFKDYEPKIAKRCEQLRKGPNRSYDPNCEDCDKQRINDKFKNLDYGGEQLIYDINAIPADAIKGKVDASGVLPNASEKEVDKETPKSSSSPPNGHAVPPSEAVAPSISPDPKH